MTVVTGKKTPMCFDILVFSTIKINVYIYICAKKNPANTARSTDFVLYGAVLFY